MKYGENITIYNEPIVVDCGEWAVEHPDCDTIIDDGDYSQSIRVYAFARSEEGNEELKKYRNEYLADKEILKGLSHYAVAGII